MPRRKWTAGRPRGSGDGPNPVISVIAISAQTPPGAGVSHIEGQVFQYTIDLTKKRKKRRQPDRREKKAPAKAIAKKQPTKPAPSRTPEEIAAAEETS